MKNLDQETLDWLALWLIPGLGPRKIQKLVEQFGSPRAVLNANAGQLGTVSSLKPDMITGITRAFQSKSMQKELDLVDSYGLNLFSLSDAGYPSLLKEVYSAPPLLYVQGSLPQNAVFPVSLVGSRKASYYGKTQTKKMIRDLADMEPRAVIVSGLALGIDTVAHETALECGLTTVAVLAGGLSEIYPPSNRKLAEKIVEAGGALVTEFPVTSRPAPANFPLRNRIISGLSKVVMVMEAGVKSGALITADYALEQNREVWALPGPVDSPMYQGTNRLIQKGHARLLMNINDVLTDMPQIQSVQTSFLEIGQKTENRNPDELAILQLLDGNELHTDILVRESGLSVSVLLSTLTKLEMQEAVKEVASGIYRRV